MTKILFLTQNINVPQGGKHHRGLEGLHISRCVFDEDVGAAAVGGQGDVVDVAEAQQRIDVRLVRLARQRVTQEDDVVYLLRGDERANLLVATERTRHLRVNVQVVLVVDKRARRMRGYELEMFQFLEMMSDKFQHLIFLFVVGNEGDSLHNFCSFINVLRVCALLMETLTQAIIVFLGQGVKRLLFFSRCFS